LSDAAWRERGIYSARAVDPGGRWAHQLTIRVPDIGARLTLETEGEQPEWLMPTLSALTELMTLTANWDSYGAPTINPMSVASALEVLSWVMRRDTIVPTVVPTVQGGVQLEWHTHGIDLEVEVSPLGTSYANFYDRQNDAQWDGELRFNLSRLQDVVLRLSRR
jgi:hypothetical protein